MAMSDAKKWQTLQIIFISSSSGQRAMVISRRALTIQESNTAERSRVPQAL